VVKAPAWNFLLCLGRKNEESWCPQGLLGSKFLIHEVAFTAIFWDVKFQKFFICRVGGNDYPSPGASCFHEMVRTMAENQQVKPQGAPQQGTPKPQGNSQPQGQKPQQSNPQGQQQGKPQYQGGKPVIAPPQKEENPNFRGIVRIAGKDLDGHFTLFKALIRVRGIGTTLAKALEKVIYRELKVTKKTRVGDLSEEQITRLDEIIKNPGIHGIKTFLLNRQKDRESGKNMHLLMNDLAFVQKQDIQTEKDIHTYKGWRFTIGQRVRGQHSRTTGRSGFTVGVMKKAIKEQKAAAAAGAQDKGKGAAPEKKK
jgi:small subunit ribosomal protein S13